MAEPVPSADTNVQRASKLDTTSISDALDRLGIAGQCLNIKPLDHRFRLAGRAFTILYGPAGTPPGTVGDYIDDVPAGSVVVLDNGGRENATVWGDILTWVAHRRGVAGTVIDGACRDTHLSRELGYPIFSRSYSMRTGKDRVQVEAMNGPVNIGDARVNPGDLAARRRRRRAGDSSRARRRGAGRGRRDRCRGTADPRGRERRLHARGGPNPARLPPAADPGEVGAAGPLPARGGIPTEDGHLGTGVDALSRNRRLVVHPDGELRRGEGKPIPFRPDEARRSGHYSRADHPKSRQEPMPRSATGPGIGD